ncbi:MAG: gluconate 2-dehydrogenase subunit 3 family protein [Xanthobacteraceae bacterium]|nr:gluconate 2-dehydrogenase subunit 3 family protein [Xanthobacteraceae bacterium]
MAGETLPRRDFLVGVGLAGTAAAAGVAASSPTQAETPATAQPPAAPNRAPEPLLALNDAEHAFVVAAVDTIIPADDLSRSGSECGVATFIDRQLASAWGGGAKMYRSGPFLRGKTEQGYQLALTPREFFLAGIAATKDWSHKTYGKDFDRLSPSERIAALTALEEGKADLGHLSARQFFNALLTITMEGFFADPIYGGNRNMASWKMLGFPGLPATYANVIEQYRDKPFTAVPQSIADFS